MNEHAQTLPGSRLLLSMLAVGLLAIFGASFAYRLESPLTKGASSSSSSSRQGTEERMKKIVALMQHVEKEPSDAKALVELAEELMALKAYDKAEPYWRRAVGVEPENLSARYHLAICLTQLERYPEAVAEFETMLGYDPGHPVIHYSIGMIAKEHLNDPAKARRHLQQALDAKPEDKQLLEQIRQGLKELG